MFVLTPHIKCTLSLMKISENGVRSSIGEGQHDLRATFGTRLGEAGDDAFTIAALMGHSDIHTTRRYVRATERNKRAAIEAAMLSSQKSCPQIGHTTKAAIPAGCWVAVSVSL
jgi:hypothetical protein